MTLLVELLGVWPRYVLVKVLFWPISVATTGVVLFRNLGFISEQQLLAPATGAGFRVLVFLNSLAQPLAHIVGWYPIAFGLATLLFLPGGFLLTRLALGARKPSTRERETIRAVIDEIVSFNADVRGPSAFYIIDNVQPNAYTIGTTLYLHSGLLSEQVPPSYCFGVIAHHLGHRNSLDGRLELALRRIVFYPMYLLSRSLGTIAPGAAVNSIGRGDGRGCLAGALMLLATFFLALAGGGLGALLLQPVWAAYRRRREYIADDFAKQVGQDGALIAYLEHYTLNDAAAPYHLHTTPANELRLDRLRHDHKIGNTMPLPRADTTMLFGSLSVVGLLAFVAFGGGSVLGLGPKLENTSWLLESFNYKGLSPVTTHQCQLFFDQASTANVSCFGGGYATSRQFRYTRLDGDSVLVEPLPGELNLPIRFGGRYDFRFVDNRLVMDGNLSFTWKPYTEANLTQDSIVGTWQRLDQAQGGTVVIFGTTGEWKASDDERGGTYTLVSDKLTLRQDGTLLSELTVSVTNDTLTLSELDGSTSVRYRKVK